MKTFYSVAAAAIMLASCANPNQDYVWKPTDPSFGHDQAVTQYAFCGMLFRGFEDASTDPDTMKLFDKLASRSEAKLANLSSGRADDTAAEYGEQQAIALVSDASPDKVLAASNVCLDVVLKGSK